MYILHTGLSRFLILAALITSQLQGEGFGSWIGLFKETSADSTFKWVDSSPYKYLNWAPNEPSGGEVSFPLEFFKKCNQLLT